ncbi:glycine betaine/L-proline ABC transporter ATP-binding protein [Rhodococcus ruber]|uniref:Glycine betaine/L-proline ABC transporter ATP-binding protein n=1 Tax=Rhodococcus ruber TaxID=1830 RepID=A0ABT4MEF0_9NOCA|nr:glycine betaine/L-proline ABC transporter ATP-binding protein [Rhodococcus ruber]MCZ4519336.1 glycine betaine/L-proline ABC transporter ATP-binding protein [Rhodococcus ruber]
MDFATTAMVDQRPIRQYADHDQASLQVRELWKVFGPNPEQIVRTPELHDLDKAQLREQTGCTAAINGVSFDVDPGEVFVIMGLSGSGKSTLIRCLTRLIEPTAGRLAYKGRDILRMDKNELRNLRRNDFAMVFQHFGLLPHKTVAENVAYGLKIRGQSSASRISRAREMIDLVGLSGYENAYPAELSGGMQQRVGLGRALAGDPDVLLFDEPFSALDPLIRRDMQVEVARLQREVGKTIIFITHDLNEALRLGDRIAVMHEGRLVQIGTGADLVGAPASEYVRDFVRDVPRERVLSVEWIMRPYHGEDTPHTIDANTLICDAIQPLLASPNNKVGVVAGDRVIGVLDTEDVLSSMQSNSPLQLTAPRRAIMTESQV